VSAVFLGLGSNVNTGPNIRAGAAALREHCDSVAFSPVYQSVAVGFEGSDFINLAARIETALQPLELKQFLNELEASHGRKRDVPKFSDRTLDIDILLWDDLYLRLPELTLPRGEILQFAHVLQPLADLAPQLIHPVEKVSLDELWKQFSGDRAGLKRVDFPL